MSRTRIGATVGYPIPVLANVRLGRLWADYAWNLGIPIGRRVDESERYVWIEQNKDEWYTTLLASAYHIVCYSTGWDAGLAAMAGADRIIASAQRAQRQLVFQCPMEWHFKLDGASKLYRFIEGSPRPALWMARIDDRPDTVVDLFSMSVSARAEDAVSAALEHAELQPAYSPVRDESQDNMDGRTWRVWCVDRQQTGWMAPHLVRVVPVVAFEWEIRRAGRESAAAVKVDRDDYGSNRREDSMHGDMGEIGKHPG